MLCRDKQSRRVRSVRLAFSVSLIATQRNEPEDKASPPANFELDLPEPRHRSSWPTAQRTPEQQPIHLRGDNGASRRVRPSAHNSFWSRSNAASWRSSSKHPLAVRSGCFHGSRNEVDEECHVCLHPFFVYSMLRHRSAAPIKRTAVERQVNLQIVFLFFLLLALSIGSTIGSSIRTVRLPLHRASA